MSGGRKQCNQRKNHSSQEKNVKDQLWLRFQITRRKINNISCLKKESGFKFAGFYRVILETSRYLLEILLFFHADIFNFN